MSGDGTPAEDELTTIHIAQGLLQAHVIRAKLEEAGIPALLSYESVGPVIGITVDGVGEVRVRVPAEHAEAARELIATGEDDTQTGDKAAP
jgi:hypothetical protein